MLDNGWILTTRLIWYKPNCMPSSAKDRFTVDYEHILFFVKSKKYYFKTQYKTNQTFTTWSQNNKEGSPYDKNNPRLRPERRNPLGRIKRTVWKIPPKPFSEAHFAVFPEELVKQCMDAGCPSEICVKCKQPKSTEYIGQVPEWHTKQGNVKHNLERDNNKMFGQKYQNWINRNPPKQNIISCNCNAGFGIRYNIRSIHGKWNSGISSTKNKQKICRHRVKQRLYRHRKQKNSALPITGETTPLFLNYLRLNKKIRPVYPIKIEIFVIESKDKELFTRMKQIVDLGFPPAAEPMLLELYRVLWEKKRKLAYKEQEGGPIYISFPRINPIVRIIGTILMLFTSKDDKDDDDKDTSLRQVV